MGLPGRPKGSKDPNTLAREKARMVLIQKVEDKIGPIADMLVSEALKGNVAAAKELLDRSWGKPNQAIDVKDVTERTEPSPRVIEIAQKIHEVYRTGTN